MKDNLIFIFCVIVGCFYFNSCTNNQVRENSSDPSSLYFVDDADHLFFKNTRAYYYDQSRGPGSDESQRPNLYQLKKISKRKDRAILIPIIVDNWIKDEAYLMLTSNDFDEGFYSPFTIARVAGSDTTAVVQEGRSMPQQTTFAQAIAKMLEKEADFLIKNEKEEWVSLFADPNDRLHYLTAIRDYQRLVQK